MDTIELAKKLAEELLKTSYISATASELGFHDVSAIIIKASEVIVAFNPKLINESGDVVLLDEISMTYPGVYKIKRHSDIRVRFMLPNGEIVTKQYNGLTARHFQNKIDILAGVDYRRKANRYHRSKAFK